MARLIQRVGIRFLFLLLMALAALPAWAVAPGDLDATFGSGGKVSTAFSSGDDYGYDVGGCLWGRTKVTR